MSIKYTDALAELTVILAYLHARSPAGSRNVMRSIQKAADLIGEYPRRGRLGR